MATLATCQTTHSRYVALRALHALLYTVKRLIIRWHAALFTLLHSRCRGTRWGQSEAGDFHVNLAFSSLDNTQRSITMYTRARVSLLSSCSLEHGPSTTAEKQPVEIQFLQRQFQGPGTKGLTNIGPQTSNLRQPIADYDLIGGALVQTKKKFTCRN